jgi:hypothetical protein
MNRKIKQLAAIAFIAICSLVSAQTNTLNVPDEIEVGKKIIATCNCIVPENGYLSILWDMDDGLEAEQVDQRLFVWGKPGNHEINAVVIPLRTITVQDQTFDVIAGPILRLDATFKITGKVDPEPPGPGPGPDPPNPDEVPFPATKWTCLILEQRQDRLQLPPSQRVIFSDTDVFELAKSRGGTNSIRAFDITNPPSSNTPQVFRDAFPLVIQQANGKYPWIAISNGTTGVSQPLPTTVDAMLDLMRSVP